MAPIASTLIPNPNPSSIATVSSLRSPPSFIASTSCLFGNKFLLKPLLAPTMRAQTKRSDGTAPFRRLKPIKASSHTFDVVVVGAGIIGLTIARQFLMESDLSVAVVDAAVPCAGATGAGKLALYTLGPLVDGGDLFSLSLAFCLALGQGYLWMVHKAPGSDKWELAMRSRKLWEMFAEIVQHQGMNPLEMLGWKKTGSLLIGRTSQDSAMLKRRVDQLSEAGLRAEFLSHSDLLLKEPALMIGKEGGAAFLPDDCQIDAQLAVSFIEKVNRHFAAEGRYAEFYYEPATSLLRSSSGEVKAVQTSKNTLYSKKAVIIAAGCWSGTLMHDLIRDTGLDLDVPVKPRKVKTLELDILMRGHLLVVENLNSFILNHGLMELGYINHEAGTLHSSVSASGPVDAESLSVSMTATMDSRGNLVLGSSRQFVGFSTEMNESVIDHIWERAGEFFPTLRELSLRDFRQSRKVRIGLRPYMADGKPVIGAVPGLSNLFLAAGHEGEGLSLALGTAEMVANLVLGSPGTVDYAPFALENRCCMLR
ncbi:hypothetical protein RHMOL_Rhmol13G0066000 [Rhododendron molle]|uniref:Uncharacterized protein n=1 Tax=Rhododendron molle TaxID=49168 RepID=A0ACC0L571_RHOML|nr:hypothetical protein RHMOL_Rhmol13G0066000 [Rhododendron molle]